MGTDGDEVQWSIDMTSSCAALLIALLLAGGQDVVYIPGRMLSRIAAAYRGEGKTDAKDSRIIADQARMRHDLFTVRPKQDQIGGLTALLMHRREVVADRKRLIMRIRDQLTSIFPALERALDYGTRTALVIVRQFQPPADIRAAGPSTLHHLIAEYVPTLASPNHLAAYAGLAPVPHDSGRRVGIYARPQRHSRLLRRALHLSAMASLKSPGPSRTYYDRKRDEGRAHVPAVMARQRAVGHAPRRPAVRASSVTARRLTDPARGRPEHG